MANLQKAFGKFTDPLPTPAIWDLGEMLSQPEVFIGLAPKSNAPIIYSSLIKAGEFGIQISPDWLPLLLEEAQPAMTRASYELTTGFNEFAFQISEEWLASLLEKAQPEITRATFTFGFDARDGFTTPLVFPIASFPLDIARLFEIDLLSNKLQVSEEWLASLLEEAQPGITRATFTFGFDACNDATVSNNLFVRLYVIDPASPSHSLFYRLQTPVIAWHNYQEKKWHTERFPGIELEESPRQRARPKKFVNGVEVDVRPQPQVKKTSFWDLIFPLLQPPLVLGNIENLFLPHNLYPYQPAGIEFLMNNESALLADEMGTGKTVMTTVALKILFQKNRIKHALIVCPLSVLREWRKHLDEWAPELVSGFVRGSRDNRTMIWQNETHVYVTTYDSLREDVDGNILSSAKYNKFDVIVVDEAQNIKNPQSGRSKSLRKLNAKHRWALTGTPVENKIDDLVALFEFLRPGFLTPYDLYPSRIKEKIAPFFLRRRKQDVLPDLPPKIKQDLWLELGELQRAEYDKVSSQVRGELIALGDQVSKVHIFSRIARLKQICNFVPGTLTSSKVNTLTEQIEQIVQNRQKAIVFSQYLDEGIEKLEQVLKSFGCAKLVGSQSQSVRDREIERFKKSSDVLVLLASVKAGGVGLNLTEASYVVHFDHWWNPAVMWQAEARVHRPGQKSDKVNVYSYWTTDTIEERIYNVLKEKGLLFEEVIDGLSENQIDELISTDEWLEMLGVKVKDRIELPTRSDKLARLSVEEIRQRLLEILPSQFEHVSKELIRCLGYPNPKVTGKSGDGGIDILATRNTENGVVRIAAQCKRYKGTVGAGEARDFMGAITVANITKGFLITTGDFSRECKSFCEQSGIIVPISGLEMARYLKDFGIAID